MSQIYLTGLLARNCRFIALHNLDRNCRGEVSRFISCSVATLNT